MFGNGDKQENSFTHTEDNTAFCLTREEFILAAKSFVKANSSFKQDDEKVGKHEYALGWRWDEGINPPFTQHLTRTGILSDLKDKTKSDEDTELLESMSLPSDKNLEEIVSLSNGQNVLNVTQTIIYSSTWKVPILYIEANRNDGSVLSASEIISSNIFLMKDEYVSNHNNGFSVSEHENSAAFPTFSIGENPANGHSCVFLHPCQTASSIKNLLKDRKSCEPIHYLEAFIMLCSTVIEMRLQ